MAGLIPYSGRCHVVSLGGIDPFDCLAGGMRLRWVPNESACVLNAPYVAQVNGKNRPT